MSAAHLMAATLAIAAAAGLSIEPAAARVRPPIVLERTSKWVVDYDDDSCLVAGAFGSDAQRMIVRLTWFAPGDTFQLSLAGTMLPRSVNGDVEVVFGPMFDKTQHKDALGAMNGDVPVLIMTGMRLAQGESLKEGQEPPDVTPAQEKATEWIDLRFSDQHWRLATGSLGAIMAAKRACTRDLVKAWGYDPAVQEALSRKAAPAGTASHWVTTNDYPSDAQFRGANGIVRFRLDVDQTGRVTACHVLKGIRSPDFEKLTCDSVRRRARLTPALDQAGKPVASYYVNTVVWQTGY